MRGTCAASHALLAPSVSHTSPSSNVVHVALAVEYKGCSFASFLRVNACAVRGGGMVLTARIWCAVGFVVLREFSVCSRGEVRMHTATWWYRDQRLRETCATQPCVPHGLPDAPLSCSVAQLARRHRTSNVELASRAICDVLAWCPWWTVSRSTRTVSVEVIQRHCVCSVVQTHRVCVLHVQLIRCVLLVQWYGMELFHDVCK